MEESMEDVAMKGSKIEKMERKRLRHLENTKRALHIDEAWNEDPIEATEIVETLTGMVEAMKDPLVKKLLGKQHKVAVNSLIDAVTAIKVVAKAENSDTLSKI